MILSALFAVLTALGALIRIPTPVSAFTLQICFTCLAGLLLGSRWGVASQILYLLLGLVGLPVFAGGGGVGAFWRPTGGFLLGLLPMAWVVGKLSRREVGFWKTCLACCVGLGALYAVGLPWMHLFMKFWLRQPWSLSQTLLGGMAIFLPADAIKIALAAWLCTRLRPHMARFYCNGLPHDCQ